MQYRKRIPKKRA